MEFVGRNGIAVTGESVLRLSVNWPKIDIISQLSLLSEAVLNGAKNNGASRGLVIGISPDHQRIAIYSEKKELEIYRLSENELIHTCSIPVVKRPSKIAFFDNLDSIILIDKAGDAYIVTESSKTAKLFLGHTSMLFDVTLTPDQRFILTADRDEKIRISHYPNAYNIHGYCLGHKEFITSVCLLPEAKHFTSASGDGTIRLWDYESCKQLCEMNCSEAFAKRENEKLLVKSVQLVQSKLVAVTENPAAILVYSYDLTQEPVTCKLVSTREFDSKIVQAREVEGSLLVLTQSEETPLIRFELVDGVLKEVELLLGENLLPKLKEIANLLYKDFSEFYHKRIDNEEEYKQRKEERIKGKRKDQVEDEVQVDIKKLKAS